MRILRTLLPCSGLFSAKPFQLLGLGRGEQGWEQGRRGGFCSRAGERPFSSAGAGRRGGGAVLGVFQG